MALYTTWSETNRVIRNDLASTFTRENVSSEDSDVFIYGAPIAACYYKYTRMRTKQYSYIGMPKAVAVRCCAAMNALYSRPVFKWEWDADNYIFRMQTTPSNRDYNSVQGGTAAMTWAGDDIWHVDVTVNEQITIPYRALTNNQQEPPDTWPYPWLGFENDPSMRTDAFRGRTATSAEVQQGLLYDYDYDERAVGWGSDEDPYHTLFHSSAS